MHGRCQTIRTLGMIPVKASEISTLSLSSPVRWDCRPLYHSVYEAYCNCYVEVLLTTSKALRPRWTTLYAARKKQKNVAVSLPELPDSFLGWIPALYKISDVQVLKSAGLDALVVSITLDLRSQISDSGSPVPLPLPPCSEVSKCGPLLCSGHCVTHRISLQNRSTHVSRPGR